MNHGHTRESLIAFEARVKDAWEAGELPSLVHLCGGNEGQLLDIFSDIRPQDWVFTNHRAHYHCLLKGMDEETLMQHIREDRSMFVFSREHRIYQSAILAGCCAIATGVAQAIKDSGEDSRVVCFLGDGASDNGHFYEALMYATGHDLPIRFVLENNDRQVDTDIVTRRGPKIGRFQVSSPLLHEYYYTPKWPHAGSGSKHHITFQRTTPL